MPLAGVATLTAGAHRRSRTTFDEAAPGRFSDIGSAPVEDDAALERDGGGRPRRDGISTLEADGAGGRGPACHPGASDGHLIDRAVTGRRSDL